MNEEQGVDYKNRTSAKLKVQNRIVNPQEQGGLRKHQWSSMPSK